MGFTQFDDLRGLGWIRSTDDNHSAWLRRGAGFAGLDAGDVESGRSLSGRSS